MYTSAKERLFSLEHEKPYPDISLAIAYQMIMDNETKEKKHCELFIRGITPEKRVVLPIETIRHYREHNRYKEITRFVFERALEVIRRERIGVHINIGSDDIFSDTGRYIEETLFQNQHLAEYLTLEVLENCEILEKDKALHFFNRVRGAGTKIALDDFGKSFCNYSRLLDMDFDLLKIDGSLTRDIDKCDKRAFLLDSLQGFARKMGVEIVAEQVETKEEQEKIASLGIAYSQGFYIHKPKIEEID